MHESDGSTGLAYEIPSREGRKPKASGWVLITQYPPRRSTAWSLLKTPPSRHPSGEGIFGRSISYSFQLVSQR